MKCRATCALTVAVVAWAQQPTADEMPQEMIRVDRSGKILDRVGAVQMSI